MSKPVKNDKKPIEENINDVDKEVDKLNNEVNQAEQDAEMIEEARKQKLEALKKQLEEITGELQELKPGIDEIYTRYETKDKNTKIEDLNESDNKKLAEYIYKYKEYLATLDEIAITENEKEGGLFDSYVVEPISNAFGNMFDKAKNGIAKLATGSGKFWTDTIARSMEEMEPSLKRIQDAKARIYGTATQGLEDAKGSVDAVTGSVTGSVDAVTGSVAKGVEGATESVDAVTGSVAKGVEGVTGNINDVTGSAQSLIKASGGGRYSNIKEVQKGGAAAAKRVENSIKQFLSSSVTSSHILKMVKQKTKANRKRNGKRSRYSRKRVKK